MKEYILFSKTDGIYLGNCMGLGFWSELDPAGQRSACTFPSREMAEEHVNSWDNPKTVPDIEIKEVEISKFGRLDVNECLKNNLWPWRVT